MTTDDHTLLWDKPYIELLAMFYMDEYIHHWRPAFYTEYIQLRPPVYGRRLTRKEKRPSAPPTPVAVAVAVAADTKRDAFPFAVAVSGES